jgi:isopenicillin-N epimerase
MSRHRVPATVDAGHWRLDPDIDFLNHGSFGACPVVVQDEQSRWRQLIERDPVHFFQDELERHLDAARSEVAAPVGARPQDLVFVANATTGINTVLRSVAPALAPGDEVLTTDHEYNAVGNTLRWAAGATGSQLVVARIPFPIESADRAVEAIVGAVTRRTRLAVISHVTSATGLVLPIERIVPELSRLGVETLVDGAHAPGMVPLGLDALGAAYYVGDGHKWWCAPKGSGFLHVRRDRQAAVRPLVISHGANSPRTDRSRFLLEADWTGTWDPTPALSLPTALRFLASLRPGGPAELMAGNHDLCMAARDIICSAIEIEPPAPDEMLGSMAALPLPDSIHPMADATESAADPDASLPDDPLHRSLLERDGIQVPVYPWPPVPTRDRPALRLLRISAHAYNGMEQYERLAEALASRTAGPSTPDGRPRPMGSA